MFTIQYRKRFATHPTHPTLLLPSYPSRYPIWLRVMHARVPAFDLDKTLEENSGAELKWDCTDEYWHYHKKLGTSNEPIEID